MTKLHERLLSGFILLIVAAVSLLAGGVLLGSASADDSDEPQQGTRMESFSPPALPEGAVSCVIAFRAQVDGQHEGRFSAPPIALAEGGPEVVRALRGPNGGESELKAAVEGRRLSEEEIAELKASGKLKEFAPAKGECGPPDPSTEVTLPDGQTVRLSDIKTGLKALQPVQ